MIGQVIGSLASFVVAAYVLYRVVWSLVRRKIAAQLDALRESVSELRDDVRVMVESSEARADWWRREALEQEAKRDRPRPSPGSELAHVP